MSAAELSIYFFLQMFCILAACRVVGRIAGRIGQPQVVGEMIAGVCLGPSLFGLFLPEAQRALFPAPSAGVLYVGAQLGVGLYMFLVGLEFQTDQFLRRGRSAAAVSIAGMVVPFVLGAGLALWFLRVPGLFSERARPHEAALFLGAAMAITAFPMLARIIYERGLAGTPLGMLALAAGAIDDAAAWCILAVVIGSFGGDWTVAVVACVGGVGYAVLMLTVGRRGLARLGDVVVREGRLSAHWLGVVLMLFTLAAWVMEAVGVHAVFGGFLLGVAMPRGLMADELRRQLEPFTVVFLLPMFFVYSGLNTRLDLVTNPDLFGVAVVTLVAACLGKGVACWAAARWTGHDNATSLAVGTLMNARGLMELIILNIGLQRGIILPGLFSIMVVMAILTTLMASPVFEWVYGRAARKRGQLGRYDGGE